MKKIRLFCGLLLFAAVLLAGCGLLVNETSCPAGETEAGEMVNENAEQAENPPEDTPEADPVPAVEAEEVTVSGAEGTISIRIPDGWLWEVFPEDSGELLVGEFGIRFWPEEAGEGYIELSYVEMFGVCGTGLEEKEISLAGDQAWIGTYDGRETWDFIAFRGENDGIVAQSCSASAWLGSCGDEALAILDTLQFVK